MNTHHEIIEVDDVDDNDSDNGDGDMDVSDDDPYLDLWLLSKMAGGGGGRLQ